MRLSKKKEKFSSKRRRRFCSLYIHLRKKPVKSLFYIGPCRNSSMDLNNNISVSLRSLISTLDLVTSQFINQLSLILTIVGLLGFIGNAFTFLQPTLRWNTFCIYTLCGSLVDILNLFINLFPKYINKTSGNLVAGVSESILCKLKLFTLTFLPKLSTTLMILSLIDRYACSSALTSPIRHLRQLKVVPWLIGVTAIITIAISSYALILYDIVPGIGCSSTSPLLNSVVYIAIEAILLPMVMLVFIVLTYQNIRQSRRRVVSESLIVLSESLLCHCRLQ